MKRLLLGLLLSICFVTQGFCADEWNKTEPLGTRNASDIDYYIGINNEALDRYLAFGRQECRISYASASTITVGEGSIVCSNSGGTIRKLRSNPSNTTVTWTDLDTGAEAASTTYYLWAIADADAATFTVKISLSSTVPGSSTYYKRLGNFYNDASSNIVDIQNDGFFADLGTIVSKTDGTTYQALTDGFVDVAYNHCNSCLGYSDGNSTPTTIRANAYGGFGCGGQSFTMPVKKGDYYKVTSASVDATIFWYPLE